MNENILFVAERPGTFFKLARKAISEQKVQFASLISLTRKKLTVISNEV